MRQTRPWWSLKPRGPCGFRDPALINKVKNVVYFAHTVYCMCNGNHKIFSTQGTSKPQPAVAMRGWVIAIRTMSRWPPSDILDCYFCMMEHSQQVLSEWLVQTHCKNLTLMYVVVFELAQFKSFWFLCSVRWTNVNCKHNIMSSLIIPIYADEASYVCVCISYWWRCDRQ